jgi:hypothetical protein
MSVSPSDSRSSAIGDKIDQPAISSGRKERLVGTAFVTLAGVAMAGWLYLITKVLWVFLVWLAF